MASSGELFRQWDLYDRVIRSNWMHHRELSSWIRQHFASSAQALRVLDLGCGDGHMARQSLLGVPVQNYCGIDLSQEALNHLVEKGIPGEPHASESKTDMAKRTNLHFEWKLICGDIFLQLEQLPPASFDVILASYSLHHFSSDQKTQLLTSIARLLSTDGQFVWIDAFRQESEDRDQYLVRLAQDIDLWSDLPMDYRADAIAHVRACDFPETESWMTQQSAIAKLALLTKFYDDSLYGGWVFRHA